MTAHTSCCTATAGVNPRTTTAASDGVDTLPRVTEEVEGDCCDNNAQAHKQGDDSSPAVSLLLFQQEQRRGAAVVSPPPPPPSSLLSALLVSSPSAEAAVVGLPPLTVDTAATAAITTAAVGSTGTTEAHSSAEATVCAPRVSLHTLRQGYARRGRRTMSASSLGNHCCRGSDTPYPTVVLGPMAKRRQIPLKSAALGVGRGRGGGGSTSFRTLTNGGTRSGGANSTGVVRFADHVSLVEIPSRKSYPASIAAALWNTRTELRRLIARNSAERAHEKLQQQKQQRMLQQQRLPQQLPRPPQPTFGRPTMLPPRHQFLQSGPAFVEENDDDEVLPGGACVVSQSENGHRRRLDRHRRSHTATSSTGRAAALAVARCTTTPSPLVSRLPC